MKNFYENLEHRGPKKYCYHNIYLNSEAEFEIAQQEAFSRLKKLATAHINKIEKRFENLPIFSDFAKLDIKKIKLLKESDIKDWGNDSIKNLTNNFKILNFNLNPENEKIFQEKIMLEQYQVFKTMINFEWKLLNNEEILGKICKSTNFNKLVQLITISRVIPLSSAESERIFSHTCKCDKN